MKKIIAVLCLLSANAFANEIIETPTTTVVSYSVTNDYFELTDGIYGTYTNEDGETSRVPLLIQAYNDEHKAALLLAKELGRDVKIAFLEKYIEETNRCAGYSEYTIKKEIDGEIETVCYIVEPEDVVIY